MKGGDSDNTDDSDDSDDSDDRDEREGTWVTATFPSGVDLITVVAIRSRRSQPP